MKRIVLCLLLVLLACSASQAYISSEDIYYWCLDGSTTYSSTRNPSTDWVEANESYLVVKVQQTVYGLEDTANMLARIGVTNVTGYLYSYSFSNLYWQNPIKAIGVNWNNIAPKFVGTDNVDGWTGTYMTVGPGMAGPVWQSDATHGIYFGKGISGLWAVADTPNDAETNAIVANGTLALDDPSNIVFITGKTTGPVSTPEPGSLLAMASGLIGLGILKRRRK